MRQTTTRGVLWELIAPSARWPLYSPFRFGAVIVVLLLTVIVGGQMAQDEPTASRGAEPSSSSSEASETPTSEASTDPATDTPTASEEPAGSATRREVDQLAHRFARAYVRSDRSRTAWLEALRPMATTELADALGTVDPANVQLGEVRRVRLTGINQMAAQAQANTTAPGGLLLDLAYSGSRWEVTRVRPG